MMDPEQKARACALLGEFVQEPTDWSTIDLARLLDLWGISEERIVRTETGWAATLRYHRGHPVVNVIMPDSDPVHPATVLHVIRIISTLRSLLEE